MSDIVRQTRDWAQICRNYGQTLRAKWFDQAADEIERLRAENATLRAQVERLKIAPEGLSGVGGFETEEQRTGRWARALFKTVYRRTAWEEATEYNRDHFTALARAIEASDREAGSHD